MRSLKKKTQGRGQRDESSLINSTGGLKLGCCGRVCYNHLINKTGYYLMTTKTDKKQADLATFIENVNKKDRKKNGLKIHFAFVNRKR